ncbi:OmpA family protein [Rubellimicrobium aerolatum]|uniref:OmpA family protein n=1 Tax=Rubellimicrobium aerolatum TaxID=490979 RepID=A0ABW0SFS2_9RHOB|nr:OmpA family protein [Rubellimicrobium aerolatum]MBP1807139.1 outer membrane protein OmpA-like peptidoglycan-associated protein [Rubellimicrobium aerolatum]
MRRLLLLPAALALLGCAPSPEAGGGIGGPGFGQATRNNVLVQSGALPYAVALSERFAGAAPTTITFAFDSADLDAPARAALARQAAFIRQFPEVRFAVYGHTDLVGTDAYNQALGLRRAQAAVAFLVAQGVRADRLQALVSRGETQPLIATRAPERANRRTVTDVTGFVDRAPQVLDGKYAAIVYRDYVRSATGAAQTGSPAALGPGANPGPSG